MVVLFSQDAQEYRLVLDKEYLFFRLLPGGKRDVLRTEEGPALSTQAGPEEETRRRPQRGRDRAGSGARCGQTGPGRKPRSCRSKRARQQGQCGDPPRRGGARRRPGRLATPGGGLHVLPAPGGPRRPQDCDLRLERRREDLDADPGARTPTPHRSPTPRSLGGWATLSTSSTCGLLRWTG